MLATSQDATPPAAIAVDHHEASDDVVGAPVRAVLALFRDDLAAVRFPDVDATLLQGALDVVADAHAEVRRLEAALDDARRRLESAQEALSLKAQRGVAYARVYADGDAALTARLEALALPRVRAGNPSSTAATTAEPGRRRRRGANSDTLFATAVDDAADVTRAAQ
jgi:hypothetical protein